ncbi:hypothetical protein [Helicobacter pylori]|uniref:hypothetical protein n=1 Tax=Helicobacter pylori TaxID=210 RepID=UPI001F0CDCB8|nr:hypothetical protein [Helicobacter pylori]
MNKIKLFTSKNWSLRNRGQAFTKNSAVAWLLMPEHLIWWFLISFSGEFVADMAFGKKSKIFKTRFGISVVSGISLLLGALPAHLFFVWFGFINWWVVFFIEAEAELISKLFYSNQLDKGYPLLKASHQKPR